MFSFSRTKVTLILVSVAILISAVMVYFIFQNHSQIADIQSVQKNNAAVSPPTALPNAVILSPRVTTSSSSEIGGSAIPNGTEGSSDLVSSFWEKLKQAAREAKQMNAATLNTNDFDIKKSTVTSAGIILHIEPEEFAYIYPKSFLDILQNTAQPFIQGEDVSFVALSEIKIDADVRMIEEKLVDALFRAGIYDNDKVARALQTIRFTLPRLQLLDLRARAQQLSLEEQLSSLNPLRKLAFVAAKTPQFLSFFYAENLQPKIVLAPNRGRFFSDLIDQLKSALLPTAQAYCGECHDLPLCFQEGLSPPGIPGRETFVVACQCTGCLTGLGCLDGCGTGIAAIFDPLTFICGCGI